MPARHVAAGQALQYKPVFSLQHSLRKVNRVNTVKKVNKGCTLFTFFTFYTCRAYKNFVSKIKSPNKTVEDSFYSFSFKFMLV
jgi:hypothetical protein